MSSISDIKKSAKEYPGSCRVGASGRAKLNGIMVSFIASTNPQNATAACYINYTTNGKDRSITSYNLDIFDKERVKKLIAQDM